MTRSDDRILEMTRDFKAPRALVFDAFSSAQHLEKWFAPEGMECKVECDFRVGGKLTLRMIGFGLNVLSTGTYLEIVRPETIAWSNAFQDLPNVTFPTRITLTEIPGGTRLHMRQEFPPWSAMTEKEIALMKPRREGAPIGWGQTLDHLATYLAAR